MDEEQRLVERYRAYRGEIEAESSQIGVRLGWLVASEAFLAAAYAVVLTVTDHPALGLFHSKAAQLYRSIPIAGMGLAFLVGISVWAALRAIGQLQKSYAELPDKPAYLPAGVIGRPTSWGRNVAPRLVPPLAVAAWMYIYLAGAH